MHINSKQLPEQYLRYTYRKSVLLVSGLILLLAVQILSISLGAVEIPYMDVVKTLLQQSGNQRWELIIWNIRLPQALTAVVAGLGLAVAGVVMQAVLNNPLGSPFTLGMSHAAAFGAAFSVMVLGTGAMHSTGADAVNVVNHYVTTGVAFMFCILTAIVILLISKMKKTSPEVMVLTGVALGSLFTAGTMFLQYFADDIQLAAMIFWTFGDVARASWKELGIITLVTVITTIYFLFNSWNYNAIVSGDETAKSIGVNVELVRILSMLAASVVTSVIIAFLGIIGFVGLICPHIVRRIIGDDHRFLIPGTCIMGSILLLAADTAARMILIPHVLPVAILTSFLGAPLFIFLIIKGYKR
ncbi:MAG: iron ABC transporter permease [Proteobacteria bacterium]|nr:iron ABC transporter permease [Pseudomonadota bacterium]